MFMLKVAAAQTLTAGMVGGCFGMFIGDLFNIIVVIGGYGTDTLSLKLQR